MAKTDLGLLVAISAGGSDSELAEHGIGMEHVEELMVRLSMRLLSEGHRLAFGGTMGVADKDLTRYLIDTAHRWGDEDSAHKVDITKPITWPLVNYSAWPNYKNITEEQKAKLVGICYFVDIRPPSCSESELNSVHQPGRAKRLEADALSAMRAHSAEQVDLRIVWAGKIAGSSGWMAGILEEVVFSLEQKKPVLVLGGFGGCSRLIADFLMEKDADWPERLSLKACASPDRDVTLTVEERDQLQHRMTHAKEMLTRFRSAIHSKKSVNGISSHLIQEALHEESARVAINIVAMAAQEMLRKV